MPPENPPAPPPGSPPPLSSSDGLAPDDEKEEQHPIPKENTPTAPSLDQPTSNDLSSNEKQVELPPQQENPQEPMKSALDSSGSDSYDISDEEIKRILEEANAGLDYSSNSDIEPLEIPPPLDPDLTIAQAERHRFAEPLLSVLHDHISDHTPVIQREISAVFEISDQILANQLASVIFPNVSKQ